MISQVQLPPNNPLHMRYIPPKLELAPFKGPLHIILEVFYCYIPMIF